MKSFLQNAAVLVVSCLIALAGIEVALRIWGPDVLALGNQYAFYRFDPVLGWNNLPNAQGRYSRSEFSYPVKINSIGMWDAEIESKRADEFRVAVLGDSFTWGVGVPSGERFTEIAETRALGINILNFGVAGFSPIQYLLQLDTVLALKPDYVVVAFCLGNDVAENVSFTPYNHPKPYVALAPDGKSFLVKGYPLTDFKDTGSSLFGSGSVLRTVGMIKLLYEQARRPKLKDRLILPPSLLYVPADELKPDEAKAIADAFRLNELLLAAIKQRIDAGLGPGRFAVMLLPTKLEMGEFLQPGSDPNRVGDEVLASLKRLHIPAIDGRPAIVESDFWKVDAHWRPIGHRKIGERLAIFLAEARARADLPNARPAASAAH
jgi:hypothetical protein